MKNRVGAWFIGARGSISTCVVHGAALVAQKRIQPVGLVTGREPFSSLDLAGIEGWVFGGHEIRSTPVSESAEELCRARILNREMVKRSREAVAEYESRIRPGVGGGSKRKTPESCIRELQKDLLEFQTRQKLSTVVVVNLASTEAFQPLQRSWEKLDAFRKQLRTRARIPASLLYAYAAIDLGMPYVNFTPSLGSSVGALEELALENKVPHCGRDGKTGETLIKTALAPMFLARNLKVMSWEGYNLLGNRDGETLSNPSHRETKIRSKNEGLRRILQSPSLHSKVSIDYVPSLNDWKTAWDFIHFQGFLDVPMSLQFTWQGSDSALAAPLVLDLMRLAEYAKRHGEFGPMKQTASFFKSPLGVEEQDFHKQFRLLEEYAWLHRKTPTNGKLSHAARISKLPLTKKYSEA